MMRRISEKEEMGAHIIRGLAIKPNLHKSTRLSSRFGEKKNDKTRNNSFVEKKTEKSRNNSFVSKQEKPDNSRLSVKSSSDNNPRFDSFRYRDDESGFLLSETSRLEGLEEPNNANISSDFIRSAKR